MKNLDILNTEQLLDLFSTLKAPTIRQMNGEYAARMLAQPNLAATVSGLFSVKNPLVPWLCKAFRPVDEETGRGYNTFSQLGKVVQRYPMITSIAPSRFDGRPSYCLVYRAFYSLCGDINMVDEIRWVDGNRYLGIGTWGFTDSWRRIALPFVLEGPIEAYRGDIGKERKGFVPGAREFPAHQ